MDGHMQMEKSMTPQINVTPVSVIMAKLCVQITHVTQRLTPKLVLTKVKHTKKEKVSNLVMVVIHVDV